MTAANNSDPVNTEISIKHDNETDLVQTLLKDYELVWNRIEGISARIIQVVGVGFTLLGAALGFLVSRSLAPIIAWILPSLFVPIFAYIVYSIYITTASLWNARFLSQRINYILKEKVIIRHIADLPEARFFSTTRGSLKFRSIYLLIFIMSLLLFSIMLAFSFITIYTHANHLQGTLFVLIYTLILIVFIISCSGFLLDLPDAFRSLLKIYPDGEPIPLKSTIKAQSPPIFNLQKVVDVFLPRSWDFIAKCFFFIFGLETALIIGGRHNNTILGLPYNHLQLINALFGTSVKSDFGWNSISDVPSWAIFALCLTYFFVEEILLQQAKFIWDDIRDVEDDKKLPHNKNRAVTRAIANEDEPVRKDRYIHFAVWQMFSRFLLSLVFGYLLGGFPLLLVFLAIALHQVVYLLWAKPRGKDHPLFTLGVLSMNVSLRFLAGVIAIMGFSVFSFPIIFPIIGIFIIYYSYSFGALAGFWKMEAIHFDPSSKIDTFDPNDPKKMPRPQSEYYREHGEYWQHWGLSLALVFSSMLFFFYSRNAWWSAIFPCAVLVSLFLILRKKLLKKAKIIKTVLSPLFLVFSYSAFVLACITNNKFWLLCSNLSLIYNYILLYEGMTYSEYIFDHIKKKLPEFKKNSYNFLFVPKKTGN